MPQGYDKSTKGALTEAETLSGCRFQDAATERLKQEVKFI